MEYPERVPLPKGGRRPGVHIGEAIGVPGRELRLDWFAIRYLW